MKRGDMLMMKLGLTSILFNVTSNPSRWAWGVLSLMYSIELIYVTFAGKSQEEE